MKWDFKEIEPGRHEQAPIENEFFTEKGNCVSLVREAIQNSLDARIRKDEPVVVRFRFGTINRDEIREYFNGLLEHIKSCIEQYDLIKQQFEGFNIKESSEVEYIVVEDFGTTGLEGSYIDEKKRIPKEGESKFYDFLYRTGYSGKSKGDAGRWGVGKSVFNKVSRIKTIFGLTKRNEDGKLLLFGKSNLLAHDYNDKRWDGLGTLVGDDGLTITDRTIIEKFVDKFKLYDRYERSGLSIIIPCYDHSKSSKDEQAILPDSIEREVTIEFFYTIISGKLVVEIISQDNEVRRLDKQNIWEVVNIKSYLDEKLGQEEKAKEKFLDFFKGIINREQESNYISLSVDDKYKEFTEKDIGNLQELQTKFSNGELLSFRINICLPTEKQKRGKTSPKVSTYYVVHLMKCDCFKNPHVFWYRAGIRIRNERNSGKFVNGLGLFVAEDVYISSFLGDAESPSHDNWVASSEKINARYGSKGKELVSFINRTFQNLSKLLNVPVLGKDEQFLADVFWVEYEQDEAEEKMDIEVEQTNQPYISKDLKKKDNLVKILMRKEGGFCIELESWVKELNVEQADGIFPFTVDVIVAYDTISGNAFKKYSIFDFDLEQQDKFKREFAGCNILHCKENKISLEVKDSSFYFSITGFDQKRDLKIQVNTRKQKYDD